jgi:polysaccharide deacetylase family protein (PEP-CTERM system associated)
MQTPANPVPVINALSFDVEDYFQVSNFDSLVKFEDWDRFQSRVERNTETILNIVAGCGVKATFFVLGWVAERFPALVRRIADAGHELATHGHRHRLIYDQRPDEFRAELSKSIDLIEQAGGQKVLGHRAASFSITERSLWAIDVLQEAGLRYDSSIFPVRHPRYGIPNAPRAPYEIRPGFWEFPMATVTIGSTNLPVAGGGYFRLYPYAVTRWGLRRINAEGRPAIVYLHPWEFDPGQPRLAASWQARFRHYNNLGKTARRLRLLCGDFRFASAREVLGL